MDAILLAAAFVLLIIGNVLHTITNHIYHRENLRLKQENASLRRALREHLEMQEISLNAYRAMAQNLQESMGMHLHSKTKIEQLL